MPLPEKSTEWPPKPFDRAQKEMRTWNAWYTGNVEVLEEIYRENNRQRPSQYAGGVVGKLARFFWGRPNPQQSHRLHVPAASDLARASADLLFAQPPMFVVGEDDARGDRQATQDRLQKLFGEDDAAATLAESAEVASALGGTYLRWWWDKEVADKVKLGAVAADAAVPTWKYDQLAGVTFWTVVNDDNDTVYRHLERHEPGRILHGLYEGDRGRLGRAVPLTEHSSTSWAADLVDSEGAIETGIDALTATYIPNVRPNRKWRPIHGLSPLGRSDFDGLEPLFDALDESYSSWMRDIDLGKARLFVDESMLKPLGPGKGSAWDSEQSIFTPMASGLGSMQNGNAPVQANQFTIRWQEHANTCAELLNAILRGAGLSAGSFSDNSLTASTGVPTATEVNSRDRLSERTRDKKINYYKAGLRPFARAGFELDNIQFGTGLELKDLPEIRFPIRPQQSPVELAQTLGTLSAANGVSVEQMVRQQHPNWSSDDVNDEVDRIWKDVERKAKLAYVAEPDVPDSEY